MTVEHASEGTGKLSKVLLIAYEYPPVLSAQSIRWYYLSKELQRNGLQVHVLTVSLAVEESLALPEPAGIEIHRVFAGPFVGSASRIRGGKARTPVPSGTAGRKSVNRSLAERLYRSLRSVLDKVVFPDVRGEWRPFASRRLRELLSRQQYDCIIGSHEPAVDLQLAAQARGVRGSRLIADMGDPIATAYTPGWRYRFDYFMEGRILRKFDTVVVTSERAAEELAGRHGLDAAVFEVIPQGTSLQVDFPPSEQCRELLRKLEGQFTIVYTGNFYHDFRNPDAIRQALSRLDSVYFVLVGSEGHAFEELTNVEVIPKLGHFDCLHLQRACTVLLSLVNRQAEQTPGKVMEYLGAGRPILHVFQQPDFAADLIRRLNRGITVENRASAIEAAIRRLQVQHEANTLHKDYDLGPEVVEPYGWRALGLSYARITQA